MFTDKKRVLIIILTFVLTVFTLNGCSKFPFLFPHLESLDQSDYNSSNQGSEQGVIEYFQPKSDALVPLLTLPISIDLYIVDFETKTIVPFPKYFTSRDALFADAAVIYGNGHLKGDRLVEALQGNNPLASSKMLIPFDEAKTWLWASDYIIDENYFIRLHGQEYEVMNINSGESVARGMLPYSGTEAESLSYSELSIPAQSLFAVSYLQDKTFMLNESAWDWVEVPGLSINPFERVVVSPDLSYMMTNDKGQGTLWSIDGKSFRRLKTFERGENQSYMEYSVSSDMKYVAGYDGNGYIEIYDGTTSSLLFNKQTNCLAFEDIAFSPDNRFFVFSGFCEEPAWGFVDLVTQEIVMQFNMFERVSAFNYVYLQSDIYETILRLARDENSDSQIKSVVPKSMEELVENICSLSLPDGYSYGVSGIGSHNSVPNAYCVINTPNGLSTLSRLSAFPDRQSALEWFQAQYVSLQEYWEPNLRKLGTDDHLLITLISHEYDFIFTACTTTFSIRFSEISEFDTFLSENLDAIQALACNLN